MKKPNRESLAKTQADTVAANELKTQEPKDTNTRSIISKLKPILLFLATIMVIVSTAFAPLAIMRLEEEIIISEPHQRAALGGELSGTNYISWLIHARGRMETGYLTDDRIKTQIDSEKVLNTTTAKLREMAEAGILNKKHINKFNSFFEELGDIEATGEMDSFGFQHLNCYASDADKYISIDMTVESRTGKVVRININSDAGEIAETLIEKHESKQIIDKYIDWLGLETINDWKSLSDLPTTEESENKEQELQADTDTDDTAALVSQESNLYAAISSGGYNHIVLEVGVYDENTVNWWLM